MKAFVCSLMILLISAQPAADARIFALRRFHRGDYYVRYRDDAQSRRKLAQGNPYACAIQTRGIRHSVHCVELNGRRYLTDQEGLREWLSKGAKQITE